MTTRATKRETQKYPALRGIMRLNKLLAILVLLYYALYAGSTALDFGIEAGIFEAIQGFILFMFVLASGELVEILLNSAENLQMLVNVQRRLLQIQTQKGDQE